MKRELEEKLKSFEKTVLVDVNSTTDKKLKEAENEANKMVEEKETEYLTEAYQKIQKKIIKLRHDFNEQVLHDEVEATRVLLKKREEIVQGIFDECERKLSDFKKTDDYLKWIERKIDESISLLGEGSIKILLSESDKEMSSALQDKYNGAELSFIPDTKIPGGVKVFNKDKKTAADFTFEDLLEAEKKSFLQKGGLAIN